MRFVNLLFSMWLLVLLMGCRQPPAAATPTSISATQSTPQPETTQRAVVPTVTPSPTPTAVSPAAARAMEAVVGFLSPLALDPVRAVLDISAESHTWPDDCLAVLSHACRTGDVRGHIVTARTLQQVYVFHVAESNQHPVLASAPPRSAGNRIAYLKTSNAAQSGTCFDARLSNILLELGTCSGHFVPIPNANGRELDQFLLQFEPFRASGHYGSLQWENERSQQYEPDREAPPVEQRMAVALGRRLIAEAVNSAELPFWQTALSLQLDGKQLLIGRDGRTVRSEAGRDDLIGRLSAETATQFYALLDENAPLDSRGPLSFVGEGMTSPDPSTLRDFAVPLLLRDLSNGAIGLLVNTEATAATWEPVRRQAATAVTEIVADTDIFSRAVFTSPNGAWTATAIAAKPFLSEESPTGQQHRQLFEVVSNETDTAWVAVEQVENWGLGAGRYQPLRWVENMLYFTFRPALDGCGFASGSDLWSLDLQSGMVTQLVPPQPRYGLHVSLSEDGSRFAYNTERGFAVLYRDSNRLLSYDINIDNLDTVALSWSPDGRHLLLAERDGACGDPTARQRVFSVSIANRTVQLVASVESQFVVVESWLGDGLAMLRLGDGQQMHVDLRDGSVGFYPQGTSAWRQALVESVDVLNGVTVAQPTGWQITAQHGSLVMRDQDGEAAMVVREYGTRGGLLSAEYLIDQIRPPSQREQPLPPVEAVGDLSLYHDGQTLFAEINDRFFGIQATPNAVPLAALVVRSIDAPLTSASVNYNLLTSESWIAEVLGGATSTTLTVQRRDGSLGYLFDQPTDAAGQLVPLFFSIDERFFYLGAAAATSDADGCGLFQRFDAVYRVGLGDGDLARLPDTGGVGHAISADNTLLAFARNRADSAASELVLHQLASGEQRVVPFEIPDAQRGAGLGGLLFAPDGQRLAFTSVTADCTEGLTFGVIDLETEQVVRYPVGLQADLAFHFPVAWRQNVLILRPWAGQTSQYLDLRVGRYEVDLPSRLREVVADGLILRSAGGEPGYSMVQDGELRPLASAQAVEKFAALDIRLAGNSDRLVVQEGNAVYIVRPTVSESRQPLTLADRNIVSLFGTVGEFLIAGTLPPDVVASQSFGTLTAVALDGSGSYRVLGSDATLNYSVPALAPDGDRMLFVNEEGVFAWNSDGVQVQLPLAPFRSGVFSAENTHVALDYIDHIALVDLTNNEVIVKNEFDPIPSDGIFLPTWHPNGQQIAFAISSPDPALRNAVRLLGVDGSTRDILQAFSPVFSPDGNWLAVYRATDGPQVVLVNLTSDEEIVLPHEGIPVGWDMP